MATVGRIANPSYARGIANPSYSACSSTVRHVDYLRTGPAD